MINNSNALVCTGNKRDYPSFVFDTKDIYSFETTEGNIRDFCLIKFNKNKFNSCRDELDNIGSQN